MSRTLYLATNKSGLSYPRFSEPDQELCYLKSEGGRTQILSQNLRTGLTRRLTTTQPPSASMGYGGLSYDLVPGRLAFCGKDRRLHILDFESGQQTAVTPVFQGMTAPALSACGSYTLFAAESDERCQIYVADNSGKEFPVKISDPAWYAINPGLSSDGLWITWLEWKKGFMPWFESQLVLVRLAEPLNSLENLRQIKVERKTVLSQALVSHSSQSVSPDNKYLSWISDEGGRNQVYYAPCESPDQKVKIDPGPGEPGGPDWVSGLSGLQWHPDSKKIYALMTRHCQHELREYQIDTGALNPVDTGCTSVTNFLVTQEKLFVVGSSPDQSERLVELNLTDKSTKPLIRALAEPGLPDRQSPKTEPEVIRWTGPQGQSLEGIYYRCPEKAPGALIVRIHGGPSSACYLSREPQALFFAEHGYSSLYINHRGSTGYGRDFLNALNGQWGIAETDDARSGAEYLVATGKACKDQLIIMGGSAGGYSSLQALCRHSDFWAAGVSLYGIGHLYDLEHSCHRFEQGYTETLVGKLPESAETWTKRSPVNQAHNIKKPLLLFHGKQDKAVPWQQSQMIFDKIKKSGIPCELRLFEQEGHGFRDPGSIRQTLTQTLAFLNKYVKNKQLS